MGTWGSGPFDNDAAGDMAAGMMRRIEPALDHKDVNEARYHYCEARAAAQFVIASHGTDILGGPRIDNVIKLLARMRSDTEWLAGWREPKAVARALDKELLDVIAKMHACKGCRKSHDKSEWTALELLVEEARCAPVPKHKSRIPSRFRSKRKPKRMLRARPRKNKRSR